MATDNLRIIYQNLVDLSATTITPSSQSSGDTPPAFLKQDTKSLVWRSSPTTIASTNVVTKGFPVKAILKIDLGSLKQVGGVVLAFTNLNSNLAEIRVRGFVAEPAISSSAIPSDLVHFPTITTTGTTLIDKTTIACPWNSLALPNWGTNPVTNSNYSYGGGTYARVWLPEYTTINVRYLTVEITDYYATSGIGRYIEVSRLITGPYWSPVYNTGYGMTAGIKDLSEHTRTESGDLLTRRGPRFQTLSFNLNWLTKADRIEMTKILLGNGMPKPLLISLFPDSTGDISDYERERAHQIYGKMTQVPGISHTLLDIYSTQLDIEEV